MEAIKLADSLRTQYELGVVKQVFVGVWCQICGKDLTAERDDEGPFYCDKCDAALG